MVLPFLYDSVSTLERKWAIPHIAASELGEVVLEWWHGDRKVTLYVSDTSVECIRVWGTDIDTEMEAKELLSSQDFRSIWAWLFD
jgi:hypothetical protein